MINIAKNKLMRYSYLQGRTWSSSEPAQGNVWPQGIRQHKEYYSADEATKELFTVIDQIVFINLHSRKDRLESISRFLSECNIPTDKITRFSAVDREQQKPLTASILMNSNSTLPGGALGCTWSHIGVLKLAKENGWKRILVLEDDVEPITTPKTFMIDLVEGLRETKKYDVLMLGWNSPMNDIGNTGKTTRGMALQTTSAYIVGEDFYDTLILDFTKSVARQVQLDVHWFGLQTKSDFYAFTPRILKQAAGYSDIESKYVDYGV